MLAEILSHYAKKNHFKGTLWKTTLKMAQIIACLFGFHGDVDTAVPCMKFCYTMNQINLHTKIFEFVYYSDVCECYRCKIGLPYKLLHFRDLCLWILN